MNGLGQGLFKFESLGFSGGHELPSPSQENVIMALWGQFPQLTPQETIQVVYAVLLPAVAPAFGLLGAERNANETSALLADTSFVVDPATTQTVTFSASWTDPVDDPTNPDLDPATATVSKTDTSLRAYVESPYVAPVAADSLFAVTTNPSDEAATSTFGASSNPFAASSSPFGTVTLPPPGSPAQSVFDLSFTQHFGDTKHHFVTYETLSAAGRFGQFFAESSTVTFDASNSYEATLNSGDGVAAGFVVVTLPAVTGPPPGGGADIVLATAVTVPASTYSVDAKTGVIQLTDTSATVTQTTISSGAQVQVPVAGTPLTVTWVPTDTIPGGSTAEVHVPCSMSPLPPLKIVKVAPAWVLTSATTDGETITASRQGNILRVYFERPFYVTGADELVGVMTAVKSASPTGGLPDQTGTGVPVDPNQVSILGLDPISVSSHSATANYSQTQLAFVTNAVFPNGQAVTSFASAVDPEAVIYETWAYQPYYDPATNYWFADIQLDIAPDVANRPDGTTYVAPVPPGYFLRLALVRTQPYASEQNMSPVSLVTFAQPVTDRAVSVVVDSATSLTVTVSGPGYFGWRPPTTDHTSGETVWVDDTDNPYALHPNSTLSGAPAGARATSTMVAEVQAWSDSNGFSGDFGWSTVTITRLTPSFNESLGAGMIEWSSGAGAIAVPTDSGPTRLVISELDYYPFESSGTPASIGTAQRRSFVVEIPIAGTPG